MRTPGSYLLRGSGNLVSKDVEVADFSAVRVSDAFEVEIVSAEACSLSVTADDNLIEHVRAEVSGSTLQLSLEPGVNVSRGTLRALVRLGALERLELLEASTARVDGLGSSTVFTAKLADASTLRGTLDTERIEVQLSGASRVELEGTAADALLTAVEASGLQLAGLRIETPSIELGSASIGEVQVTGRLVEVRVSGAAGLRVRGNPTLGSVATFGAAHLEMS